MSKCWYCNEELTTANYCDEHIGICTKCYGSMFKTGNEVIGKLTSKISDLEAKLAEKNKQLRAKIGNMKSTDFIKMCISCGFLVDAKVVDNQDKISFCIAELEKIKNLTDGRTYLAQYISQRIEKLKAENSMPLGEENERT